MRNVANVRIVLLPACIAVKKQAKLSARNAPSNQVCIVPSVRAVMMAVNTASNVAFVQAVRIFVRQMRCVSNVLSQMAIIVQAVRRVATRLSFARAVEKDVSNVQMHSAKVVIYALNAF